MKYFAFIITALILAACGFTPVYGTLGTSKEYGQEDLLSYIQIENIPDREGQFLRNALIDRFYRSSRPHNPQFRLSVSKLQETRRNLDITETADATRGQLVIKTTMQLSDFQTGEVLLTRDLQSVASFNILGSEFATRGSVQSNRENALDNLARQIETQTMLYLKNSN
ncbi:MAG: LPS assembly lipoprotein LptE [Alphaproteobacteria bacterium]